ncbi:MAG: hypothetical protein ACLP22_12855 [Solirubrobacteraceae bacterium]
MLGDIREEWERVFASAGGACTTVPALFLPLLIASGDSVLVNSSGLASGPATIRKRCWARSQILMRM